MQNGEERRRERGKKKKRDLIDASSRIYDMNVLREIQAREDAKIAGWN